MDMFSTARRKAAFGAVGLLAAVAIGGTALAATSGGSSTSPSGSTTAPAGSAAIATPAAVTAKAGVRRDLLARAEHATVEVKVKGQWVTYTLDRGQVTAATPTSITLKRPDGQSVTDSINASTTFQGVSSATAVTVGKAATVVSQNGAATRVAQKAASGPAPQG